MIRKIALAGAAGAVALGGLAAFGATGASAGPPTITAGPGSDVTCSITSKAKLAPALKDNWVQSAHSSDPNPAVVALPDTSFASPGPVLVSSKSTGTCSGNVTDGTNTAGVTSAKIALTNDPAHPGSTDPATCAALVIPDPNNPSTARYNTTISWKATGAKVTSTTITDSSIGSAGGQFSVTGGTISGSFAGGTSSTTANPDSATLAAFISSNAIQPNAVSSANPSGGAPCQPTLKAKAATNTKPASASLKAGKGVKKIGLDSGSLHISR